MLIVQRYHSIHEIDPEFIPSIETLLKEEVPSFKSLIRRHDGAPESDVFTYFLFFGPTQNTPIGFSQLTLRKIPSKDYLPWWRKLMFWKKDHLHWRQAIWKSVDGSPGFCVFDSKFSRSGKEKMQSLIFETEARVDIQAQYIYSLKGLQDYKSETPFHQSETFVLEPMPKSSKSYQDYLAGLPEKTQGLIKNEWRDLHRNAQIQLGDYVSMSHVKKSLPLPDALLEEWKSSGVQLLTFEHDDKVLGAVSVHTGKDGNIFFEPFPFEAEGSNLISDDLYIQYALLKFFEMPEARRCHLQRNGEKISFDHKDDLVPFLDEGFQFKTIVRSFNSKLPNLHSPL